MKLPRLHGVEISECPWLPEVLREGIVDQLGLLLRVFRVYETAFSRFFAWAARNGNRPVLDLGSGSATHVEELLKWKAKESENSRRSSSANTRFPSIKLSDLFPNISRFERLKKSFPEKVDFVRAPVNVTQVGPACNGGLRCIFSAFHHLRPKQAAQVLADAVRHSNGIFIFEPHQRKWRNLLVVIGGAGFCWIAPFFPSYFSWKRLFLTWPLPILPLLMVYDGVVSVLRMYTREEFEAMIHSLPENDFEWEFIEAKTKNGIFSVLPPFCVIGSKRQEVKVLRVENIKTEQLAS